MRALVALAFVARPFAIIQALSAVITRRERMRRQKLLQALFHGNILCSGFGIYSRQESTLAASAALSFLFITFTFMFHLRIAASVNDLKLRTFALLCNLVLLFLKLSLKVFS